MCVEGLPLLRTKLEVPPPHAHTLPRERLLAQVAVQPRPRLVLLSAPAGCGKTTALATWCRTLAERRTAAAWLALDEGDNDPARFLAYLRAAVARVLPGAVAEHDPVSGTWARPDAELALTQLINALASLDHNVLLVLDDYHAITAPAIHAAVAFLLEHLPAQACIAIGSRADPPLSLARLRVREQMTELRAADLRFTQDEVETFFRSATQLEIGPAGARAIMRYVEGWPAGVQLVALALGDERLDDAAAPEQRPLARSEQAVIAQLSASQHVVFAYLAEEVFERQPAHRKSFLLHTAILDRLCAPLCDAVLGLEARDIRPGEPVSNLKPQASSPDSYSRLVLDELEHANLFLSPLDGGHRWYRYDQIFRAFLHERLGRESPQRLAELHRRAADWFEYNQLHASAVEHALAGGDSTRAAGLIERVAGDVVERGEHVTLQRWLEQIPAGALAARPALCLSAAWAALLAGEVEQVEAWLERAEHTCDGTAGRRAPAEVAHLRAHLARLRHDPAGTTRAASLASRNLEPGEATLWVASTAALGAGQLLAGELDAAHASLVKALARCETHNLRSLVLAHACLGDEAALRGRLSAAAGEYEAAIGLADGRSVLEYWEAALRLGDLARERDELDQAQRMLRSVLASAEQAGTAIYLPAGYIALARTLGARHDFAAADGALEQARRAARRLGAPAYLRQIDAWQARLALARGDVGAAQRWRASAGAELERCLSHERLVEALTLARVLIAEARAERAIGGLIAAQHMLERLRQDAASHGRSGCLIEILVVAALAQAALGCGEAALRMVCLALELGCAEGYTRVFLDEGTPMRHLLAQSAERRAQSDPIRMCAERLLSSFPAEQRGDTSHTLDAPVVLRSALERSNALVEPLSERELEVLRLVASGASNHAIAVAMVISVGTVKSHVNHILGKLSAHNRTEAVARARELMLLAS
jgi:LuxR family maltose regulon positive regulatory protein